MKQKKKSDVAVLLGYAGSHKGLTFLGLALSAVSMLLSMAPYICIWLAARDLIAVAPDWTKAQSVAQYGWLAFAFAVAGIILYFAGLMCTHLAAFRTASNIRKQGVAHVMKAPLGFFDSNASGLIRGRLDAAAADTETLLAHNLADIVGTITLFIAMLMMGVGFKISGDTSQKGKIVKILAVRYGVSIAVAAALYFFMPLPLEYRQALAILPLSPIASAAPAFTADLKGDFGLASAVNSISIVISIVLITATLLIIL